MEQRYHEFYRGEVYCADMNTMCINTTMQALVYI